MSEKSEESPVMDDWSDRLTMAQADRIRSSWGTGRMNMDDMVRAYRMPKEVILGVLRNSRMGDSNYETPPDIACGDRLALTREVVATCRRDYRQGESIDALARRHGVAAVTMRRAIKGERPYNYGEPVETRSRRGARPALSREEVATMRRDFARGATIAHLARTHGVARPTAAKAVKGLEPYDYGQLPSPDGEPKV